MRLLVTRPRDEAERTATRLHARGHDVTIAPMLTIEPISGLQIPHGRFDAVLMTSGNAARMLVEHPGLADLLGVPVLAVGARTAQAARDAGFANVTSAEGDGGDLSRLAAELWPGRQPHMLYLAGDDRARDLPAELRPHGIVVETVVAYRAVAATILPAEAADAAREGRLDGVLHYSQRTADIFLSAVEGMGLSDSVRRMTHYGLSRRVVEPLRGAGWPYVRIAPTPNEDSLLDLIGPG